MAESTIGLLRVVLSSNSAEFSRDMGRASKSVDDFDKGAKNAGRSLTAFSGGAKDADQSAGMLATSVGRLTAGFTAALVIDRVISGVISFGREAFNSAGKIVDLASKTGLTMRSIQEMEAAAVQTGASLDQFTTAAFQLGVRLAGGSNSVVGAVQALGLSYKELRALSPDEQFRLIAERLGEVQNAQERNKLAVELFGRSAKDVLPAIAQGYREIADSAIVAGDQQLLALDMASDALDSAYNSAKNLAIQLGGGLVIAIRETWRTFMEGTNTALIPFTYALERARDAAEAFGLASQDIPRVHGAAAGAIRDTVQPAKALTMSWEEMDAISKKLTDSIGRKTTSTRTYTSALREVVPAVQAVYGPSEDLAGLQTRTLQETGRLTIELQRWAQINSAVLAPSIEMVSAALEVQETLTATANTNWVGFAGTVQQQAGVAATASSGFMEKLKGLFGKEGALGGLLSQIGPMFTQAFLGGGGALGAMKAFATQALQSLMSLIPGVGPFLSQFAGPIIAGLSRLASRARDILRNIFGGPSADELAGRGIVQAFEDELAGMLTEAQRAEAGTDAWRQTVIALRDAYIAAGRTEEEALRDAERLWESSRDGAEAARRVIEEIRRIMQNLPTEHVIDIEVRANVPDGAGPIDFNNPDYNHTQPVDPGFAVGTAGRFGSFFKNFGAGMNTRLHGVEAVLRPQDALPFANSVLAGLTPSEVNSSTTSNTLTVLPVLMGGGMSARDIGRAAARYLAQSGLPNNESGVTDAIEAVVGNWRMTYAR